MLWRVAKFRQQFKLCLTDKESFDLGQVWNCPPVWIQVWVTRGTAPPRWYPMKYLSRVLTANEMPSFRLTSCWTNCVGRLTVRGVVSVFPGTLPTIQLSCRTAYKSYWRRRAVHPLKQSHGLRTTYSSPLNFSLRSKWGKSFICRPASAATKLELRWESVFDIDKYTMLKF